MSYVQPSVRATDLERESAGGAPLTYPVFPSQGELPDGKWHDKPSGDYIANAGQVKGWLEGQQLQWTGCMLEDTCEAARPIFSLAATIGVDGRVV